MNPNNWSVNLVERDPALDFELSQLRMNGGLEAAGLSGSGDLEAIILLTGRPALFIRNDDFEAPKSEIWTQRLETARDGLRRVFRAVGRIELRNHPTHDWAGTGWLVAHNRIVTNRHVALFFADQSGTFRKNALGTEIEAWINFRAEHLSPAPSLIRVDRVLHIEPEGGPDLAILEITKEDVDPIAIAETTAEGAFIAAIGYPAFDSRNNADAQWQIFGDIYDVKRLAPGMFGKIAEDGAHFQHDCSTLGGSSGSVLIELESCRAVGLHFSGHYLRSNYAVPAARLKEILVRHGVDVSGAESRRAIRRQVIAPIYRSRGLAGYRKMEFVPEFDVSGEVTVFASPDSISAVTAKIFSEAKRSIEIATHDFSAVHVKTLLEEAIGRGVAVSLMIDGGGVARGRGFVSVGELADRGAICTLAPSAASPQAGQRYFHACHQTVAVVDERVTIVQSANYSPAGVPVSAEAPGNREYGIAVESREIAKFFSDLFLADSKRGTPFEVARALASAPEPTLIEEGPFEPKSEIVPSETFRLRGARVRPLLSPDNYQPVVEWALKSATSSIDIQLHYLSPGDAEVQALLAAIRLAREEHPELVVRILITAPIGRRAFVRLSENIDLLEREYELRLGAQVRVVDPNRFLHAHAKLICVDRKMVIVGSHNWSEAGLGRNREVSLMVEHASVAKYFGGMFEADWRVASRHLVMRSAPMVVESAEAPVGAVVFCSVDYEEV